MFEGTFFPGAVVLEVYGADHEKFGMVKINYMGKISDSEEDNETLVDKYVADAYVLGPYGYKPTTDEAQASVKRTETPMNQQYGVYAPPRRGDRVIALKTGDMRWFILGTIPTVGGNQPAIADPQDLNIVHRSGSSIRFNDTYPTMPSPSDDEYDGITGSVSMTGNRHMNLVGSKFLPFGLLQKHATETDIDFDLNDGTEGYSYSDIFANTDPDSTTYYAPWEASVSGKKLLSPPDSVGTDTYYLLHQGGGLVKVEDLPDSIDDPNVVYSGTKIAASGLTIGVGRSYWNAGLQDSDTSHGSGPDSTINTDELRIVHSSGAYIEIDSDGKISIVTADGQDYSIEGTGTGTVKLGESTHSRAIKHGDSTSKHIVLTMFGTPSPDAPDAGHDHTVNASQNQVWISDVNR